jgi:hypothetical protein
VFSRLLVAAVAAFGVSACTTTIDGSATPDPAVAPPAPLAITDLSKAVTATLSGKVSAKFTVDSTTKLPGADADTAVTGAFRRDDSGLWLTASMTLKAQDVSTLSFVLTPTALYVRLPASAKLPPDKPWVRATDNGTDTFSQQFAPLFASLKQATLSPLAVPVDGTTATLTGTDLDPVGLVPARHYGFKVDLNAVAKELPAGPLRDTTKQEAALGGLVADVWVGSGNVPLRSQTRLDVPASIGTLTVTRTYSDWGKPVDVWVPPDSQLSPAPSG